MVVFMDCADRWGWLPGMGILMSLFCTPVGLILSNANGGQALPCNFVLFVTHSKLQRKSLGPEHLLALIILLI